MAIAHYCCDLNESPDKKIRRHKTVISTAASISKKRDKKAAKSFFEKAIIAHGAPEKVTIDKSRSNKSALNSINLMLVLLSIMCGSLFKIFVRDIKYLNNIVEQDRRGIKRITKPTLGFEFFDAADATIAGIECHRMLRKAQHQNVANMAVFEQFYAFAA